MARPSNVTPLDPKPASVRVPGWLVPRLDAYCRARSCTRAEAVAELVDRALRFDPPRRSNA